MEDNMGCGVLFWAGIVIVTMVGVWWIWSWGII